MYANYAERAYFTTDACHHCAAYQERERLRMIDKRNREALRAIGRRTGRRARAA